MRAARYEDDDDDDDDDGVLALAHFPEALPGVTNQAMITEMHLDWRKQTDTNCSAHSSIIPVRQGNGTNELWYTIPCHFQPNNTMDISMVIPYCMYFQRRKKKK